MEWLFPIVELVRLAVRFGWPMLLKGLRAGVAFVVLYSSAVMSLFVGFYFDC